MEQCFTHLKKRQNKISFSTGRQSPTHFPIASGFLSAVNTEQMACMHPSCTPEWGTLSLPFRGQVQQWGWTSATCCTCLKRTKEHTSNLKQGRTFLYGIIRMAQAVRTLYLLVSKCSVPSACFYATVCVWEQGSVEVKRLHAHECLSQWFSLFCALFLACSSFFQFLTV